MHTDGQDEIGFDVIVERSKIIKFAKIKKNELRQPWQKSTISE